MLVKTILDKIPNEYICYKDIESLGFSWLNSVHKDLLKCVFISDYKNDCVKISYQRKGDMDGRKNNERLYWILHSIELGDERPKVKISKTLFKILSFFNLCEEV